MSNIIVTATRKYKFDNYGAYAPGWFVMGRSIDFQVDALNLPLSQDDWQKCSTAQVEALLLAEGHQTSGIPATGYWTLDGQVIDDPYNELGDEFSEVCEWVEITPAKPGVFVHEHSATDVAAMMDNAVNELATAEAQKAAAALPAYMQEQLDSLCAKHGIVPASTSPLTITVSGKWMSICSRGKKIAEYIATATMSPSAFNIVFAMQKEAAQAIAYHFSAIVSIARAGTDQVVELT